MSTRAIGFEVHANDIEKVAKMEDFLLVKTAADPRGKGDRESVLLEHSKDCFALVDIALAKKAVNVWPG
jgi:hypothetical protein